MWFRILKINLPCGGEVYKKKSWENFKAILGFKIRDKLVSSMNFSKTDVGQENDTSLALALRAFCQC